jgi:hypothetical protein
MSCAAIEAGSPVPPGLRAPPHARVGGRGLCGAPTGSGWRGRRARPERDARGGRSRAARWGAVGRALPRPGRSAPDRGARAAASPLRDSRRRWRRRCSTAWPPTGPARDGSCVCSRRRSGTRCPLGSLRGVGGAPDAGRGERRRRGRSGGPTRRSMAAGPRLCRPARRRKRAGGRGERAAEEPAARLTDLAQARARRRRAARALRPGPRGSSIRVAPSCSRWSTGPAVIRA